MQTAGALKLSMIIATDYYSKLFDTIRNLFLLAASAFTEKTFLVTKTTSYLPGSEENAFEEKTVSFISFFSWLFR